MSSALNLTFGVLRWFGLSFLLPIAVALYYRESVWPFVVPALLSFSLGWIGERLTRPADSLTPREGFLVVAVAWLSVAAVGAVPYLLDQHTWVDALFESMSGFTTTGATVLTDIEAEPKGLLMWRQFTQWLGGMGIIVLALAVLPKLSVGGRQLMETEAPGPQVDQLTPHLYQTARLLWKVYLGLTVAEAALLWWEGMSLFDSVAHALTTMATGGFSPHADSLAGFGAPIQWTVAAFMLIAGTSFALLYRVGSGRPRELARNAEFRFYLTVVVLAGVTLALMLPGPLEARLRHGLFQAASVVTTTGFASADFNLWGTALQFALLLLMFFGGCAGSTGGGVKVVRVLLAFKYLWREVRKAVHPSAVIPIRLGRRVVDEGALGGVVAFVILYMTTFAVGSFLLLLDAQLEGPPLSVLEGVAVAASALGNVGPGFGAAGPMGSYAGFSDFSKELLVLLMWAGRLELFPALVLLTRGYWRR